MAEEEAKKEEKKEKKGLNLKVIFIGLPLFIVQLVLVYFITVTFFVKSAPDTSNNKSDSDTANVEETEDIEDHSGQKIFKVEDLIINPAGTSGQRLLLLSVGFGVASDQENKLLEENEVIIKDMIINIVSQKSLGTLSKVELKDSLKVELAQNINRTYPKVKVKNVYFSKYLIN